MTVRFHPAARLELREARGWYEDRSTLASIAFAYEVAEAIDRIAEAPARHPVGEYGTRRSILPKFPFSIIYRADENDVVIVALAHHKRRPGYWHDR